MSRKDIDFAIVVSSSKREIIKLDSTTYLYIPLTENEREELQLTYITNACLRVSFEEQPE